MKKKKSKIEVAKRGERLPPIYKTLSAEQLLTLQRNPQYLTPQQMESLKASIVRDGFLVPLVVRPYYNGKEKKFEILSGNHRFMAGEELGLKDYPVVITDVSDNEAKRIAMNLNTIHGEPPPELIAPFLADLDEATLREIHLDEATLTAVLAFDEELGEKLKRLQLVDAINNQSVKSPLPDCVCPKCGKRHASSKED